MLKKMGGAKINVKYTAAHLVIQYFLYKGKNIEEVFKFADTVYNRHPDNILKLYTTLQVFDEYDFDKLELKNSEE